MFTYFNTINTNIRLVCRLRPFPGMHHLDVAGGTGDVGLRVLRAIRLAEMNAATHSSNTSGKPDSKAVGSVTVSDINADMLQAGKRDMMSKWKKLNTTVSPLPFRRRTAGANLSLGDEDIKWVVADAEKLPFDDNSFDSYTIAFGIRNVTNITAALDEAYRVLKPGGVFICLEFSHINIAYHGARNTRVPTDTKPH